jgi:uncharacterized protein with PIN domain
LSISFYLDEHIPRAVETSLRMRGVDVLTTQNDGRDGTPDPELLDRATLLNRILVTRDHDFLVEARNRQVGGEPFSGIVFAHQLRVTIGRLIEDLELIAKAAEPDEVRSRVIFLPL